MKEFRDWQREGLALVGSSDTSLMAWRCSNGNCGRVSFLGDYRQRPKLAARVCVWCRAEAKPGTDDRVRMADGGIFDVFRFAQPQEVLQEIQRRQAEETKNATAPRRRARGVAP